MFWKANISSAARGAASLSGTGPRWRNSPAMPTASRQRNTAGSSANRLQAPPASLHRLDEPSGRWAGPIDAKGGFMIVTRCHRRARASTTDRNSSVFVSSSCTEKRSPSRSTAASCVSSAPLQTASLRTTTWKPRSIAPSTVANTQTSVSPPVTTSVSTPSSRRSVASLPSTQGE